MVTGGAGFIGSHLAAQLVKEGATVVAVDNLRTGSATNLAELGNQIELIQMPLEKRTLVKILRGAEVVFHCAGNGYVPPSVARPYEDFKLNLVLTLQVLEWLRLHSPQTRIVLFSSATVYGNPRRQPVDEDHPLDPTSPYAVSKLASERYGAVYARLYSMPVASLRCFPTYGPRQRKQVVYDLMLRMQAGDGALQVLGDGSQVRDLCFVEDVAKAALTVATRAPMRGEAWNVGSGRGMTIRELVDAIGDALGLKAKPTFTGNVRPGDLEAMVADCTRLAQLGWKPVVPLEEGLKATLAWLRQTRQPAFV